MNREKIVSLQATIRSITEEIEALQKECSHLEFEKGLSIVGHITPVLICKTCGFVKPEWN